METIREGKNHLKKHARKGTTCPCCGQFVKIYKRKIDSGMAQGLIAAYKKGADKDFIHVPTALLGVQINSSTSQFSKLRYWDLVEEQVNNDTKKRTSGHWKLTDKGIDFVLRRSSVKKYVYTYNQKIVDFGDSDEMEDVNIEQCLGNHFNYQELMRA